jgi:hypothetical protein
VSVRLRGRSTALCTAPNWDELHVGCFALAELGGNTSTTATWAGAMALEKCARACVGSAAFYTAGDTCGCLEAKPTAATHHPAYFCNLPCSAEAAQLCGASVPVCGTEVLQLPDGCDPNVPGDCICPTYIVPASVYNLPATLSTNPGGGADGSGPCSFARVASITPLLESVTPRTAAFNTSLELRGSGFLSGAMLAIMGSGARCEAWCRAAIETNADGAIKAWDQRCFRESALEAGVYPCGGCAECGPTVSVCGGQACAVEEYNATYVRCRMPACAAAANESTLLHVLGMGYAAAPISTSVAGELSLASVATSTSGGGGGGGGAGVAAGSAAGGVLLTIAGEGFGDEADRMQVLLRTSGGNTLAACVTLSSSSTQGTLTCRTEPSEAPLSDAGTLCDVRVSVLSIDGTVVGTREKVAGFQMLSGASSPLVEAQSTAGGSELGGAALCLHGQRLNGSSAVVVAIGGVGCPLLSANQTSVCCVTPASASAWGSTAAALNVTLTVPVVGDALFAAGVAGTFTYTAPPTLASLSPPASHVGGTVHLQGSNLTGVGGAAPEVTLGGVACAVVSASSDSINCTAGDGALGSGGAVVVHVAGIGLALTSSGVSFTQQAAITAIGPTRGSAGGGTPLTLTGAGFHRLGAAPAVSVTGP